MAEKELKEHIREEILSEKNKILAEAKKKREILLKEVEREAQALIENYKKELSKTLIEEKASAISQCKLEGEREVILNREKCIQDVWGVIERHIKNLRQGKNYSKLFNKWLEEALKDIEGKILIKVNPEDLELTKAYLSRKNIGALVEGEPDIEMGVCVSDAGEKVSVVNTMELRLERLKPFIRKEIINLLFV